MAGLTTGGPPVVKIYHEKSMILPDVSRVLACLYEKDVNFSTVKACYKDILRLQVTRSVPVPFYDGTTSLQESRAICRYIAETYEHRGYHFLLGKDALERASIEQWLRHEEHAFDPPSRALFCHLAFPLHDEDMDAIDREKRKLEEVLEVYEQRLGECEFLAGNKFTLADLVHLPNTHHIVESEKFAYLYDSRKNVRRWWNTISARDSWQQVVMDMESVEEEYQMEELEQQEQLLHQQWHTESPSSSGVRTIRVDPRKQTGTESQTVLVPPPSGGAISSSFFVAPREEEAPPKTSRGEPSPIKREESNFFTTTEKTSLASKQRPSPTQKSPRDVHGTGSSFFTSATPPTTTKMPQRTNTDKSTSKETSSPNRTSRRSSKEAPNKLHLSDFYKASSHVDEAGTLAKPTPRKASKTSDGISVPRQTSEVTDPDKPSPGSAKAPPETDRHDIYETESKHANVDPSIDDNPVRYAKSDSQTPKSPSTRPAAQRAAKTSGPGAGDTPFDQISDVQIPYAEQPSKKAKKASADQQAAAHLPENLASKYVEGGTARQARHRDAEDITNEAREAGKKGATSAPTKGLPSGSQYTPQQSKSPPTDLKASDISPMQEEYEDTEGAMDGDERFSTKRLRKMLEHSDPAALQSQSTYLQAPRKQEETPPVYNKPAHVQDRKGQADNVSADGRTDSTPSTGARPPDTPSRGDERRATSPPKGGIAPDDHVATEPRKSPSISEQESTPPVPRQSPTSGSHASASSNGAAQDDDLAQLSAIDQWRHTSPQVKQGVPDAGSIDKLDRTTGVHRRLQPNTLKKTPIEQSDKTAMDERAPEMKPRQEPPSDTLRTSAPTPPSQKPVSSSQKIAEPIKGVTATSDGITGDGPASIEMADESVSAIPTSDGRTVSTALQGSTPEVHQKSEVVKPSVIDPRGMPTTPKRAAATPDTQPHISSENKKQGGDATLVTEFNESKEDDFVENSKKNDTAQTQATSTDGPSKQQKQSDKKNPISSKDISNEAVYYDSSTTSRDMLPSVLEKTSMAKQPMQDDRSSVSLQDNEKQGSEGALPVYKAEQSKRKGQALPKSEEQTSLDTEQQVENRKSDRKADGSSKPTQFDGNEGDVPESQKGSTSTKP